MNNIEIELNTQYIIRNIQGGKEEIKDYKYPNNKDNINYNLSYIILNKGAIANDGKTLSNNIGMVSNGKYDIYIQLEQNKLYLYIDYELVSNWNTRGGIQGYYDIGNPSIKIKFDKLNIFTK